MEFIGWKSASLLTLTIILVIAGVYFLGQGITGKVISQSCCFPPNCPQENLCDVVNPSLESPSPVNQGLNFNNLNNSVFLMIGFGLLIAGLLTKVFYHKSRK